MNLYEKIIEKLYLNIKENKVYYDSLTKVNNRMYCDMVVKNTYEDKRCYVIFIDIDNLKHVNDNYGHEEGDARIIGVARELKELPLIKEICRIGGDEFFVIADENFNTELLKLLTEVSCGYYLKGGNESLSEAMKKADKLMYAEKREKKIKR